MHQQTAHSARLSRTARAGFISWLGLLALSCAAWFWPGVAMAAPSPFCGPFNVSVAHGGSITIDASACDGPADFGIGLLEVPPTHGTATVNTLAQTVTYAHAGGGDTATSDSFVFDDGNNNEVTVNVTIGAASPITISPGTLSMTAGTPFSQQLTATGGTAPYIWALASGSTLPAGLTFNASGLLSGTPTARGNHTFTVQATDNASLTASKAYTLTVGNPTLSFSPANPTAAVNGVPYTFTFTPVGGVASYALALESGSLPPGLSLSGATLSGTPTALGSYTFGIRITDSSAGPGTYFEVESVTLVVNPPPTITVNPTTVPAAAVGAAYSQTITGSGGIAPYTFAITAGALPAGLSLSGTGTLSGTPTAGGTFNFTVTATDANSFSGSRAYSLTVSAPTIVVAPTTLPAGAVATAYSQTINASGGTAPYTRAITAGALPAGMSLSGAGILSGTPTAGGTFNFTVTATDSSTGTGPYTGSRAYSLTINAATVVLPATTLANGTLATAYSATLNPASGGTAPYAYALSAGALPAGLSLSSSGALSGTPTANGTFNFSVTATDSSTGTGPYTATQSYALTIVEIAPVANAVSATVGYGSAANAITLNITGGTPTSVAVGTAPAHGTAIASGLSITYQPNAGYAGPDSFTYTATNAAGTSAPATVTITVSNPTITVSASAPFSAQTGAPYTQTFTWNGGASPYSAYSVTGLPAGLSITGTTANSVTVSGTPTAGGSFSLNASAVDSSTGNGPFTQAQAFTLTVGAPTLSLTPAAGTLTVAYGSPYSQAIIASGGTAPYSYALTAGALPPGVSFSSAGLLSGTPTVPGSYSIALQATDSSTGTGAPYAVVANYVLQVGAPTIAIAPTTLPNPVPGVAYSQTLTASGGIAPYAFSLTTGALPVGISFSSAGVLSGTPVMTGTFNFTVAVQDANGQSGARAYSVTLAAPVLTLAPTTLPAGSPGVAYNQSFSTSGGIAPYSYSLDSGALPIGISFSSAGVLSGTPTVAGTFNFVVRSTDSTSGTAATIAASYSLTIAAPTIAIAPASLPAGGVGTPYAVSLSASGGTAPYSYALTGGSLPPGVSFSSAGAFNGTPTTSGNYNFTVQATDSLGFSASRSYTIAVADTVPVAVADSATTPAQQPITIAVTGNDSGVISAVAIASGPAHGTAAVSGTSIVYTPATGYHGADSLSYTAIGPGGSSAPATVSITVTPLAVPQGQPQTVTTLAGQAITIDGTLSASGGPFTGVAIVTAPSTGTATVSGTNIVYTPPTNAAGSIAIGYTLSNAFGASAPIIATVTVNPLPVAVSRQVSAIAGTPVVVDLTAGASGGPFTAATLVSVLPASSGTATIAGSGGAYELTFTPAASFAGLATVTFTLANAFATSAPATVDIEVTLRPDPTLDAEVMGVLGAQASATRRFANAQIGNFQQRMEGLHGGNEGARFQNRLTFATDPACNDDTRRMPDSHCPVLDEAAPVAAPAQAAAGGSYSIWTGGSINSGDRDGSADSSGFDFETTGVSLGADYRVNRAFVLGGGIGYGRDDSDIGENGSRSDADSLTLAVYGSYHPGEIFFVDGLFGYQRLSFDSRRYVAANGGQVSGERDGTQWLVSLSAGGDYRRDRLHFSPYARFDLARATLDGYTEQGDAIYALRYEDQDVDTSTASLGLRLDYRYPISLGTFSPQLRLEYQHDFQDDGSATMSYADLPGGPFYRADVQGLERNRFVLGLGAMLHTARDLTLRFEYRGLFGSSDDTDHGVLLNIEKTY
ncbi:outer membrane autotransporter protein [Pseudoxanthomonas sacheonensis]|uniref:Outer membrane autotransporter protein n=1 Tax=Pseudoxanthomonas sacheonensis TaxID=443615 RepID=A0ABU1RPL4_9GAMM|nr:putative Ig domain-containing protein [Pseudoxanthomonas sacheonensis]MDR6840703.1 outer membrane autotransporter protein [Pseudoxanthomonas sacheonensis]